ncbi:UNVERIFIED_CONTAM: hypothetical protein ITH36_25295, partial [Salmonella enterica subsp. enterica serovar Weltevreden]
TWEAAKCATDGIFEIQHKNYKTLTEAKMAGDQYSTKYCKKILELKSSGGNLKATFTKILKKERKPQQMVSLGRIYMVKPIEKKDPFEYI